MTSKSNVFDVVKRGHGALPTSNKELIGAIGGVMAAVVGVMAIGYVSGKAISDMLACARIEHEIRKEDAEIQKLFDKADEILS